MAKVNTADSNAARPTNLGTWIILIVGVTILTVVGVSVPHLVGRAGWASGEKFLYLALIAYLGASALHVLSLTTRQPNLLAGAEALARGGLLLQTGAIVTRWVTAGHAPLTSIYEMVLVFSWAVVVLQEVAQWKLDVPFLGAITLPIASLAIVLLQVLPSEIRPLVPALQSTWLQIHVTLAMLSYAGFTLSFALALLFLIKDGVRVRTFLGWTSALVGGIYAAIILTSVDGSLAFLLPAWDAAAQEKVMVAPREPLLVSIPSLGWPFVAVLGLAVATLLVNLIDSKGQTASRWGEWAGRLFLACVFAQGLTLVWLLLKVHSGPYFVPQVGQSFEVRLAASPFLLAGIVSGLFASLAWEGLSWKCEVIANLLPQRETLDGLIYKTVAISFPLLTLMIIAGAYWANRTWGSYWSWDPKEDWALVTWLTYAAYLHMRLTHGWRGRRSAYFAIVGFAVVMFTFFGVTYLLPGLHAYA